LSVDITFGVCFWFFLWDNEQWFWLNWRFEHTRTVCCQNEHVGTFLSRMNEGPGCFAKDILLIILIWVRHYQPRDDMTGLFYYINVNCNIFACNILSFRIVSFFDCGLEKPLYCNGSFVCFLREDDVNYWPDSSIVSIELKSPTRRNHIAVIVAFSSAWRLLLFRFEEEQNGYEGLAFPDLYHFIPVSIWGRKWPLH